MKVYVVRHGETEHNARRIHQTYSSALSDRGVAQANAVASRLTAINADMIISSRYTRAIQTARIISKATGVRTVSTKLLNEIKRPTVIEGHSIDSALSSRISERMRQHYGDPHWRYSDGENPYDFERRVRKFVSYLESKDASALVVVTHGHVITMLIYLLLFDRDFSVDRFHRLAEFIHLDNTGITELERRGDGSWRLMALNDYAHLG